MKTFLVLALLLVSCASNPNKAQYKEEKNAPKFGNTRSYVEAPEDILIAARAVLDELARESDPPTAGSVKGNDETVRTGWVYSVAKNKYVEYQFNGIPKRKPLKVRRKYAYTVTPNISGSQVVLTVEEELQKVNFKTGEDEGWNSVETDPQVYDMLTRRLREKLRTL